MPYEEIEGVNDLEGLNAKIRGRLDEDTARMQAELLQGDPEFVKRTDDRLVRLGERAVLGKQINQLSPSYGRAIQDHHDSLRPAYGDARERQWAQYPEFEEAFREDGPSPVIGQMKELLDRKNGLDMQLGWERGHRYGNGTQELGLQDIEDKVVGPDAVWKLFDELKISNPELATMPAAEYLEAAKKLLELDCDIISLGRTVEQSQNSIEWLTRLKVGKEVGIEKKSLSMLYDICSIGANMAYYDDYSERGRPVHKKISDRVQQVDDEKFNFREEKDKFFKTYRDKTIDELYDEMQEIAKRVLQAREEEAAEARQKYEEAKQALLEWGRNSDSEQDQ